MRPPRAAGTAAASPPGTAEAEAVPRDEAPLDAILVLSTLGAPERRWLRGRRGQMVDELAPKPVPTTRATVVQPRPFDGGTAEADRWLDGLRSDRDAAHAAIEVAVAIVNRGVRAFRLAAADAYVTPVASERALVVRLGYGEGAAVADGLATRAWELPEQGPRKRRRSMEAPEERFAAILGGRTEALACEELVLRAAADLHSGRTREAALEARVALEALLAELPEAHREALTPPATGTTAGDSLADARTVIADAANAALRGPLPQPLRGELKRVVEMMERCLRNRRLTT